MNPELSWGSRLKMEVGGQVLLPLAVSSPGQPGFSAFLPPAPTAPPAPRTKETDGAASGKAGKTCAPPPGPSRVLLPVSAVPPRGRRQGTPRPAWGDPTATSSHRKALRDPDPRPWKLSSVWHWPWGGRVSQPSRALTSRTAASRYSRPAADWASPPGTPAASFWPVGWGQPGATRRCEARPQAPLIVAVERRGAQDPRRPRSHPGCKLYRRARSEPGTPTQKVEREGQAAAETPLSCGEDPEKGGRRR